MSEETVQKPRMTKRQRVTLIVLSSVAVFLVLALLATFWIMRSLFQLKYVDLIQKYCEEYDLEPSYVAAVIYTESKYRERALSGADARGLMQIMPKTAADIAREFGEDFDPDDPGDLERLYDPETSIRYGCYYLRKLLDRFDRNPAVALAAYNGGPENTAKWLKEYGLDSKGRIAYIPFPETSNYVKRVFRAQKVYEFLYSDQLKRTSED